MSNKIEIVPINVNTALKMCDRVMSTVYNNNPPSPNYLKIGVRLLLGTGIQESAGFIYARQIGFKNDNTRGGWGYWQTELQSLKHSYQYMKRRMALYNRVKDLLNDYSVDLDTLALDNLKFCKTMITSPMTNCVFSRLHYLKFTEPIPNNLNDQAEYWKKYYNTVKGKGTPQQYIRNWNLHTKNLDI